MEDNFFRCFSIQLTSNQLDALLAEMEAGIDIPDNILKVVSVVGKNINQHGTAIWALNRNVFIDGNGNVVNPEDHGLVWISHLVLEPGNQTANEDRRASINLPLTTMYFDLMCHFLRGSVQKATEEDPVLATALEDVLRGTGLDIGMLNDQGGSGNFLPSFFTVAMSIIISHYDVVCFKINYALVIWGRYINISNLAPRPFRSTAMLEY